MSGYVPNHQPLQKVLESWLINVAAAQKLFIKKLIVLMVGLFVMSVGIALFLKAQLGANPLTTLTQGIAKTTQLSIGQSSQLLMITMMVVVFFIDKQRLGIGTVLNAIFTGVFIDIVNKFVNVPEDWIGKLLLLTLAIVTFAVGLGTYISSKLGEGAVDSLMVIIKNHFGFNIQKSRMILDVVLLSVGWLLGGSVGVGTIIGAILTGPIMKKTMTIVNEFIGG